MKELILRLLPAKLAKLVEYKRQKFIGLNERSIEYGFVFQCITELQPKTILDVGSGTTALPHLMRNCGPMVTAIDNISDYWPFGMTNRHYKVLNKDITNLSMDKKFDMISCVSTLEHIENYDIAIKNMLDLLEDGGHLVLTVPFSKEYNKNVYELECSNAYQRQIPFICQSFTKENLKGQIVKQEFWQCWTGDYWTCGEQIKPSKNKDKYQLSCILIKK
jgi:ubiquinone/menaquinone biosynthesis C-methylase UbiE